MKRVALYALHYGKEYLAHSMRSVQDAVDAIVVYYAPKPSFGQGEDSGIACPDTEQELFAEAMRFLKKPVIWHKGQWTREGTQRTEQLVFAKEALGAELAVVVDADEVWHPFTLQLCLDHVHDQNRPVRWTADFCNFWRSFGWYVQDPFRPIRIVDLRHDLATLADMSCEPLPREAAVQWHPVYHFGYAQRVELMRYKWTCHGHQRELRDGWIDRFVNWQPGDRDLHPTVNNLWPEAEQVPRWVDAALTEILGDHPYRHLPVIP